MKIGIIELGVVNHYLAVESLANIYLTKYRDIEIDIYGPENLLKQLKFPQLENIKYINLDLFVSFQSIIEEVNNQNFDRLHFITLMFSEQLWKHLAFRNGIFLGVHFTDEVFVSNFKDWFKYLAHVSGIGLNKDLLYNLRKTLHRELREYWFKRKIVKKNLKNDGKVIVYGNNVYKTILRFVDPSRVVKVPFCLYKGDEEIIASKTGTGAKLKIVIPGIVNPDKRNYVGLMNNLVKSMNSRVADFKLVFLGKVYLKDFEKHEFYQAVSSYQRAGGDLLYFENFIDEAHYNSIIEDCNFILGNINLNSKYGEVRETGVIFNMIRYAKPGLLPYNFGGVDDLEKSIMRFNDYEHLGRLILDMIDNKVDFKNWNDSAIKNAKKFSPEIFAHQF